LEREQDMIRQKIIQLGAKMYFEDPEFSIFYFPHDNDSDVSSTYEIKGFELETYPDLTPSSSL